MKKYVAMLRTDPDDRDIVQDALRENGIDIRIQFLDSIRELDELVRADGEPALLLVNDNEAVHNGYKRLEKLKANKAYNHIPVVVLGEISNPEYIKKCYQAGANSFVVKPSTVAATNQKIRDFFNYWFRVAEL